MMDLDLAIASRRELIAKLQAEIEKLEAARELLDDVTRPIASGRTAKPPPKREAAPSKPMEKRKRSKPGDPTFACGHERGAGNLTSQGRCRRCKNAAQLAYLAKKAGKPVSSPPTTSSAVAPPEPARVAAASKWQKQCPALDFESGRRCSLLAPRPLPHSASGRTFTTAVNPSELPRGGGREIALQIAAEEA